MTQSQSDDIIMFDAVKQVVNTNISVWTGNIPFTAAVNMLQTNLTVINGVMQSQHINIKGVTQTKAQTKETLISNAVALALAGKAFAAANNNMALKQACTVTKSELLHTNETELASICQSLHDTVNPFINSMNGYGVSAATQTALQTSITSFSALVGTPRSTQSSGASATEALALQIKNTKALLDEQLDGLIEQYKLVSPTFYNAYHTARKLVTHGHVLKVMIEGVVTKAGVAVAKAVVVCMEDTDEHRKVTDTDGKFRFLLSSPVNTTITASLDGFATQTKPVISSVAQTLSIDFAF